MVQTNHQQFLKRTGRLSLILAAALSLQGCLAISWLAAVGVDSLMPSSLTFWPFEQSWVAPKEPSSATSETETVTSVVVLPVDGDEEMTARLTLLLKRETLLRVEVPISVQQTTAATGSRTMYTNDTDRSTLAQILTRELGVDTVLISRVAGAPSHPSDWGSKVEGARRLYLYLVNHDGRLLWKDELPFTVVKGATPPVEESVQSALSQLLMDHVHSLHLDELGYLPTKSS